MMTYRTDYKYRGIALLIGNKNFDRKHGEENINRKGCSQDLKMMTKLFKRLDFRVKCYKDLKAQQMMDKIEKACTDKRNKDCDCFALVLSSHGSEEREDDMKGGKGNVNYWYNEVMGTDRKTIRLQDILNKFDNRNAPMLAGKPKMFFIQACRVRDNGVSWFDEGVAAKKEPERSHVVRGVTLSKLDDCDDLYASWERDSDCWQESVSIETEELVLRLELQENKPMFDVRTSVDDKPPPPEDGGSKTRSQTDSDCSDSDCWPGSSSIETEELDIPIQLSRRGNDKVDSGASGDNKPLPQEPVDILNLNIPEDCLVYFPAVSGKYAIKNSKEGSYMFQSMLSQFPKLIKGQTLTQYLTCVNKTMADCVFKVPIDEKIIECKTTALFLHRMDKRVEFKPKSDKSPMAKTTRATRDIEKSDAAK